MLVKFFARGTGGGRGPVEYITRKDSPSTGQLRYPAPFVIRGNPVITRRLIDSLEFKHKYRSGVLSFAPEDAPTDKQIEAVIDSFEEYAFAGLDKDAYNTLWVKHTHTGNERVELHFVTPRVELYTGKSLNIAPPGWHGYFKPWQTSWNIREGWARPDDLARKRIYEPGFTALCLKELERAGNYLADPKQQLNDYIVKAIEAGTISNRDEIISAFEQIDLKIPRKGKTYITVLNPETNQRYRLKGGIYEASWRLGRQSEAENRGSRTTTQTDRTGKTTEIQSFVRQYDLRKLEELRQQMEARAEGRREYNARRYGSVRGFSRIVDEKHLDSADIDCPPDLSEFLARNLGDDAFDVGSNGRANPDSATNIRRSQTTETTLSNNDDRVRKQTDDRFGAAIAAIQAGHDRSIPQVQHGHESARSAEQTATISGDALKHTGQELERANREAQFIQQQIDFNLHRIGRTLKKRKIKQLERFKTEINLVEYAMSLGYEYDKSKSTHNKAILSHESGDKIVVVKDESDRYLYFSFQDNQDKGTIIDFLQHRLELNLGEVRKELRPWLNRGDRIMTDSVAKPQPMSNERISLIQEFLEFSVLKSHPYLAKLGISDSTLMCDRFIGRIAVDEENNLIIPHYDDDGLAGYVIAIENKRGFSQVGSKALWQSNPNSEDTRLIITKTVIDALSIHQLFPDQHTRYIAVGNMPSSYQKELIVEKMAEFNHQGSEIIIAISNDEAGEQLANTITSKAPSHVQIKRRQPENSESWNEVLQRQIQHDRALLQLAKQKSKQNERSQLEP